jgi:hypothetical protein
MTWRHLDPPPRRQREVGKNLRTPVAQVFHMKRLKKRWAPAESVTPPHVPTASVSFGWMAKSVKRQLAVSLESDTYLAFRSRWIELRAKPSAHILLFNREVVHVCLTYSVLSLKAGGNQALRNIVWFDGRIKRVGLNRVAAVQLRLWGLYHTQRGRGRHLAKDRNASEDS